MECLFEGLEEMDREEVLSKESKYGSEADAERYVKSRKAVDELERKELREEEMERRKNRQKGQQKGRGGADDGGRIVIEWLCGTCGRTSAKRPLSCELRKHVVTRKRDIRKRIEARDVRDELGKKDSEDGGMVLGKGLDWSGWRGGG